MTIAKYIVMAFILGTVTGSVITAAVVTSMPQDGPTASQIMQMIPAWCGQDGCQ